MIKLAKKRVVYLDVLRILAIFGVICIHVSAENWYIPGIDHNWLMNSYINSVMGAWTVPLFITISGALLLDNPHFTYQNLFKKYLPRILICLVFWHFFYYFYVNKIFTWANFYMGFKQLLLGKTYSHLWYLYLVIGLYLLTPILKKMCEALTKKDFIYFLTIGFTTTAIIPWLNNLLNYDLTRFVYPYYVFNFNYLILFYLLGYFLKNHINLNKKQAISLFAIAFLLINLLALYGNYKAIKINNHVSYCSANSIVTILMVIALFLLAKTLIKNKEIKFITLLSNLTFGVYLTHFVIEKTLLDYGINSNIMNPILGTLLISGTIMTIAYIISFVLSKIPILKKLIGLSNKE